MHHGQHRLAGRLIAVRRSAEATRAERERLTRKASKQQREVSAESWQAAQYIMLWTSLPATTGAEEILEFYRCRWQIETYASHCTSFARWLSGWRACFLISSFVPGCLTSAPEPGCS